ncbi:MAG: hypothetical protein ACFCVA_14355, partial [Gammaproteobacteria bacterium]
PFRYLHDCSDCFRLERQLPGGSLTHWDSTAFARRTLNLGQVFGFEKTQLLAPEYPVRDLLGNPRFIDFALKTAQHKIAFEVDGPSHYGGFNYSVFTYEDD